MEKLGMLMGNERQVKTTTHVHPVLHHNITSHHHELQKKPTTSPASTLSDKGIGSSVGSFDSEFRHESSAIYSKVSYDPNKTGSLDSRTQDGTDKLIPAHTRSSSDIIYQSTGSGEISQPLLAEQSNANMWTHDPRRLSKNSSDTSSSTVSSSIRPRKPSLSSRRQRSRNNSAGDKEVEVKKLPQLYGESPVHSNVSCSQSTTSTGSTIEMGSNNGIFPSFPVENSFPAPLEGGDVGLSHHNQEAPPLPPKTSQLRHQPPPNNVAHVQSRHHDVNIVASILTNRLRQDGPVRTNALESLDAATWAQDSRREIHVPLKQGQAGLLSAALSGIGKAESVGRINGGELSTVKFHGSTNALLESNSLVYEPPLREDETFQRRTITRSSGRFSDKRRTPVEARSSAVKPSDVTLQALRFDLPQSISSEGRFVGREWLFNDIMSIFASRDPASNKAAVITGDVGHGKSSIIEHIVSYSYHGWRNTKRNQRPELDSLSRMNNPFCRSSSPLTRSLNYGYQGGSNHSSRTGSPSPSFGSTNSRTGSQISLTEEACRKVASQVVAFHFCQSDSNTTCFVPEFIHSIAAQMSFAPQLTAYRELLMNDPSLREMLTLRKCVQNPSQALIKAILEPLESLKKNKKLTKSNLIILIDAINEAELYRPDYGHSILSFLREHLKHFPDFVKVVMTCRSSDRNQVADLPGQFLSLDADNQRTVRDMQQYIAHRIATSAILSNLALSGKSDPAVAHKLLTQFLIKESKGNFLYLRMTLDLIDQGDIVPKSAGFKVVPINLNQVFLQQCNLRFRSYTSFDDVRDVISVALASLYPLKDEQLYQAVCSDKPLNSLSWGEFKKSMETLDGLLVENPCTGGRAFFHPLLREWFMGHAGTGQECGTLQSSNRFKVDVKRGYFLLATVLSRLPRDRLDKHATLELAHHVLKAGMFKAHSKEKGVSASDINAHFMADCSSQLTAALVCPRNLFYPSVKVSKLLLRAGANPNVNTQVFCSASPLGVAAHTGCIELAELLLMFDADVNFPAANGMSALTFAAAAGRLNMVKLLLQYRPELSQRDQNGHTALQHAISRNHSNVAELLLSPNLYVTSSDHLYATQQALVAAATTGDTEFVERIMESKDICCDVNILDATHGESPLTSAAARGKAEMCEYLIRRHRAKHYLRNKAGCTPLLCAVKQGEWDTTDTLLNCGAAIEACDPSGKTPVILAAFHGHLGLLELLMSRGADVQAVDKEGLTALGWSAVKGHADCVRGLIGRSDVGHVDANGRTALSLAAFYGDPQVVDLLLEAGADIHHTDEAGMCAMDRAISNQQTAVVSRLLVYGAAIQQKSWALAQGKQEILSVLLSFSLDEANSYYKRMELSRAHDCFAIALKQVGELGTEGAPPTSHSPTTAELCAHLLLGFARCCRKQDFLDEAESAASRSLELKPYWHEALYVRSRVLREKSRLEAALRDVMEAERTAPAHSLKEIKRLIEKIKEEIRNSGSRGRRPSSVSSDIIVPHQRPRLNSSSSYHGNSDRSSSPQVAELSRSHQSRSFRSRLVPLATTQHGMAHGNSQESLAESMACMSVGQAGPYPNDGVRRFPRTTPHWHPHAAELTRSMSADGRNRIIRYQDHTPPPHYPPHVVYTPPNPYLAPPGDPSRPPLVTDL